MADGETAAAIGRALWAVWHDLPALAQGQIADALKDHPGAAAALNDRGGGERLAPRVQWQREVWQAQQVVALARLR